MKKGGQMKISFGMIFSIILIIIFLSFSFYAISKFLELQENVKIEKLQDDLQSDVDKMWKSPQGSQKVQYLIPNKIESVCFTNDEYGNFILNARDIKETKKDDIEHIDIVKITEIEDPFCVENDNGKVKMILKKDYGEALVLIERQ
jgi:hypothetical protein